jgi:hypothetical protein
MHTLLITTLVLAATLRWSHLGRTVTTLTLVALALRRTRPVHRAEILSALAPALVALIDRKAHARLRPPRTDARDRSQSDTTA